MYDPLAEFEYALRRSFEEDIAASNAQSIAVRRCHKHLADLYAERAQSITGNLFNRAIRFDDSKSGMMAASSDTIADIGRQCAVDRVARP